MLDSVTESINTNIISNFTALSVKLDIIVSYDLFSLFDIIVNFWCILFLSATGAVSNILCAWVFIKQGFKDGVNISLLTVTIWNELKCLSGLLNRMYGPVSLNSLEQATFWRLVTSFNQYTPIFSGYVAYCLMAYISLERFLCVAKPFEVKSLLAPHRTLIAVLIISIFVFGAYVIMYFIYELTYTKNNTKTTLSVQYNAFYKKNEMIIMVYYKGLAILLPTLSFLTLCACSLATLFSMKKSSRLFRTKRTREDKLSLRVKKVTTTLLVIILVNIINLLPRVVFYIGQLVEPEFYVIRYYHNLFMTVAMFIYILDYMNAAVNLFIFLAFSVSFRSTLSSCLEFRTKAVSVVV